MSDIASRLKQAREAAGFQTGANAADALHMKRQTYYAHENGNRIPKHTEIEKYARRFKVSPEWLLTGRKHGISEASIEAAMAYLFRAVPTHDLAIMDPSDLAEITIAIAKASETGKTSEDIASNILNLLAERVRRAS